MKYVVLLLALVGLVSCGTTFIRADRDRDLEIKYSVDDDDDNDDDDVKVFQNHHFTAPVLQTHVVQRPVTLQVRPEVRSHFVPVEVPRPVFKSVPVVVPSPAPRTQVVQLAAPAVPAPVVTQYIRREPQTKSVVVQSQALPLVPVSMPRVVTQYVQTEHVEVPRPVVARTSFVQTAKPVRTVPVVKSKPVFSRTSFVQTANSVPVVAASPVRHQTYSIPSFVPSRSDIYTESYDSSDEK